MSRSNLVDSEGQRSFSAQFHLQFHFADSAEILLFPSAFTQCLLPAYVAFSSELQEDPYSSLYRLPRADLATNSLRQGELHLSPLLFAQKLNRRLV